MVPILVINLPDATGRMEAFRRHWSEGQPVHRVDAVDGRNGRLALADVDLSVRTRHLIRNRLEIADIMTLHSAEAVANFLSHRACWRLMLLYKPAGSHARSPRLPADSIIRVATCRPQPHCSATKRPSAGSGPNGPALGAAPPALASAGQLRD